jgi:D-glycero-D-manno-heptose 1,7-bisphosphate phosphatase
VKLIILDRDGVINQDRDDFVKSADEWQPIDGSLEAIARLNQAGFHVVVATNQSGLARGFFSMAALNAMHSKMHKLLADKGARVDAVFLCPHTSEAVCDCRKPNAGLFTQIARRYGTQSLRGTPTVGDSLRDLQAGAMVGCALHAVRTGKGARTELAGGLPLGTTWHNDLAAFTQYFIVNNQ